MKKQLNLTGFNEQNYEIVMTDIYFSMGTLFTSPEQKIVI
jgi:hypothetical protein